MNFSFFFITYQALLSNNRWLCACVFPLPRLRTVSTIPRIASISPPFEDGSEHGLHLQNLKKKKRKSHQTLPIAHLTHVDVTCDLLLNDSRLESFDGKQFYC